MGPVNRVLILASEPVIAALIGMLIEIAGRTPVFADHGETPSEAVVRLRPLAVVLVDASLGAAHSDIFFAVTDRHGLGTAVFGAERDARSIAETAAARSIPWLTLPPTADELARALAVASGEQSTSRGADRRASPDATVAPDGTRILRDRVGNRWMVYDRRSADRRTNASGREAMATRVFVSEIGERRECGLPEAELAEASAQALETQLARAT